VFWLVCSRRARSFPRYLLFRECLNKFTCINTIATNVGASNFEVASRAVNEGNVPDPEEFRYSIILLQIGAGAGPFDLVQVLDGSDGANGDDKDASNLELLTKLHGQVARCRPDVNRVERRL